MGKKSITGVISLLLFGATATGQEIETVTYYDNFTDYGIVNGYSVPILQKELRLSKDAGNFYYDTVNVPDSVDVCIRAAIDIWESKLRNNAQIKLEFEYTDFDTDNDVIIDVSYDNESKIVRPKCLHRYLNNILLTESESPDARIQINKNKDWDCNNSDIAQYGTRNLTYALLRSIGVALGFGSSVTYINDKDIIAFACGRNIHTVFDTFISDSDGNKLSDVPNTGKRNNNALNSYVQPTERYVYALKDDEAHRMYAPETYDPFKSLVYLDNYYSLMHYDPGVGEKNLRIDDTTIELLNAIGWDMPEKEVEIIGENIDSTGIASAYQPHKFTIKNYTGKNLSNAEWQLSLPLKDGGTETICQNDGRLDFEIPQITDETRYAININGDIYGTITFTAVTTDLTVSDTYRVSLELKPHINAVHIVKKESNSPYDNYNLYYTIEYTGTNKLYIQLQEQYGGTLVSQEVNEPYLAHVVTKYINSPFSAKIHINAENKYGSDKMTLRLPPYILEESPQSVKFRTSTKYLIEDRTLSDFTDIDVYGMTGEWITNVADERDLDSLLNGIYVLRYNNNDKLMRTAKYIKK